MTNILDLRLYADCRVLVAAIDLEEFEQVVREYFLSRAREVSGVVSRYPIELLLDLAYLRLQRFTIHLIGCA